MPPPLGDEHTPPSTYLAFMLRLWRDNENATWHASLQTTDAGARLGFGNVEELCAYLRSLIEPDGKPGHPTEDTSLHAPDT